MTDNMREDFDAAIEKLDIEIVEPKNEIITPLEDGEGGEVVAPKNEEIKPDEAKETPEKKTVAKAPKEQEGIAAKEPKIGGEGAKDTSAEQKTPDSPDSKYNAGVIKAPIGWTPAALEDCDKVHKNVQEQIHKREQEIATTMQGTGEARKTHDHLNNLANSFAPIMAAEGANTPMEAIEGLFKTVAELRMGSPVQKAQKMAALIGHYGIDIEALDSALTGQMPADPQMSGMESMIDQKLAPINQVMEQLGQLQAQGQQTNQTNAATEVTDFAKNAEFLNDVRVDMADLIDMASNQGRNMPLEEAYNKACAMHPEISKVLDSRKAAEAITNANTSAADKANAASSISGKRSGVTSKPGGLSMHDQISDAWDEAQQG